MAVRRKQSRLDRKIQLSAALLMGLGVFLGLWVGGNFAGVVGLVSVITAGVLGYILGGFIVDSNGNSPEVLEPENCKAAPQHQPDIDALLNTINHAILITDSEQRIIRANKAASKFLDFNISESVGRCVCEVIENTQYFEALERYTRDKEDDVVFPQVLNDDSVVPGFNQIHFSTITMGDKQLVVTVLEGSHHDQYASKIRERFIDRASHEFRTPLAAIRAYIEMLLDGEADDEKTRQAFYNIIQNETTRLTSLVEKVLKISRIEAGEISTSMEVIKLDSLVDVIVEEAKGQCQQKGVSIQKTLNREADQTLVFADKELLSEAMSHVLSNAIKFTPRNEKVSVESGIDVVSGVAWLEVKDRGVGISSKELPYIFEKFYRGETNEWYAKGAGLGLSLTKHIVKDVHGGRVIARSEISQGSVFRIELPLRSHCVPAKADEKTHVKGSM